MRKKQEQGAKGGAAPLSLNPIECLICQFMSININFIRAVAVVFSFKENWRKFVIMKIIFILALSL